MKYLIFLFFLIVVCDGNAKISKRQANIVLKKDCEQSKMFLPTKMGDGRIMFDMSYVDGTLTYYYTVNDSFLDEINNATQLGWSFYRSQFGESLEELGIDIEDYDKRKFENVYSVNDALAQLFRGTDAYLFSEVFLSYPMQEILLKAADFRLVGIVYTVNRKKIVCKYTVSIEDINFIKSLRKQGRSLTTLRGIYLSLYNCIKGALSNNNDLPLQIDSATRQLRTTNSENKKTIYYNYEIDECYFSEIKNSKECRDNIKKNIIQWYSKLVSKEGLESLMLYGVNYCAKYQKRNSNQTIEINIPFSEIYYNKQK